MERIRRISGDDDFEMVARDLFAAQRAQIPVYDRFLRSVHNSDDWRQPSALLPVEAFKYEEVFYTDDRVRSADPVVFRSSGTTLRHRAKHVVVDPDSYRTLSAQAFEARFGPLSEWVILALLPSYLENGESSLVFMADHFIRSTNHPESGFIEYHPADIAERLHRIHASRQKCLLLGVSYALLDLCEAGVGLSSPFIHLMETGGMKGRREEWTRDQLHHRFKQAFPESAIHSEYGMTELLSQAYAHEDQWFKPPPWMRARTTDPGDPLCWTRPGQRGALAFWDLANVYSCSFVQTRDLGVVREDGCFRVEGRVDHSDLRGCNLLYT